MKSTGCSRVFAVLFGIVFILAVITGLLLYHIEFTLLNPEPYVRALQEGDLAENLTEIASRELAASLERDPCFTSEALCESAGGPPAYFSHLSQDDWKEILDLVITPDWIREQAEVVLRGVFQFLTADREVPPVSVDIQPIKARLRGGTSSEVIKLLLGSLPNCTDTQIAELSQLFLTGGDIEDLLVCSPPPEMKALALPILDQQLALLVHELPDQVNLPLGGFSPISGFGGQETLVMARKVIRQGLYISAVLAAVSLLLVMILAVRSWRGLFTWLGWPILLVGLLVLGFIFAARTSSSLLFQYLFLSLDGPSLQAETVQFVSDLFQAIIRSVMSGLMFVAGGMAATGVGLIIVARLFPATEQEASMAQRPEDLY